MKPITRQRATRGFTIVELLVTLVIAFLLMTAIYQFFTRQQKGYSTQDEVSRLQAQARNAQDFLVRAIQQAGAYNPDGSGATISLRGQTVLAAGDHYLTIQYDDPYRTADPGVITEEEVVTFVVSSEPPNAAPGATEQLSDDGGATTTVAMWFDQDRADGVEPDERFDVEVPITLKGPPYTLYRVTPDKDDPTDAAKLHAEPIATGVDNLVFKYFDQNGAPVPRDPASGAAGDMPYVLTTAQRSLVRSVEVELALRATRADKTYKANPAMPDFSVATYDASGAPRAGAGLFANDGYRRRIFRTRITPRNLSVNNCGSLTLYADDAQPRCPASTTIRATVQNRFGQPVAGVEVLFNADAGSFSDPSPTTDASGNAVTELQYTDEARTISVSASTVVDCSPEGPDHYTLVSALPVNFVAGDPSRMEGKALGSPIPTQIDTCGADNSWQVEFTTYDACDNKVMPLPGLFVRALDEVAAGFGTVDGAAEVEITASPQAVTLRPPAGGPYASAQDVNGYFTQTVGEKLPQPAWFTGWKSALPSIKVRPWPPHQILDWSNALPGFLFDDCSRFSKADIFRVVDCRVNSVYRLPGAPVTATLTADGVGPVDQGMLTSTNNPGFADTDPATAQLHTLSITESAGAPWYNITYTTPEPCGLSPQTGQPAQMNPRLKLELPDTLDPPKAPDPAERTLTVRRCAGCDLAANPAAMTECAGQTTITVSGCQLNGQTVELEVTSDTGFNGSFRQGGPLPTKSLVLAGNNPSTASATLYLGEARDGTNLKVRAYYPSKAAARWQCDPIDVRVSSLCQKLRIYSDPGYSKLVSNAPGSEDCLAKIRDFYFEVDDCQDSPGVLRKAVTVYAISRNGTWLDKEEVDLVSHRVSGYNTPTMWRSVHNLPLVQSAAFHLDNDGALQFPPGRAVQFVAQYRDPNDSSDPPLARQVNLTAPVTLPLQLPADDCMQSVTMAVPLPICFPNAITSGGGGQWNGNYQVHWGDVVIRGDADTASVPKRIAKDAGAALGGSSYGGAGNSDRFFDIYVGFNEPTNTTGGNLVGAATTDFQPYQAAGFGNYFQRVSYDKITEMMAELDYDIMKELAKERGVYWYTKQGTTTIRNPTSGKEGTLEQVLSMAGPGQANLYGHDGKFIFVDTFGAADPGPATTGNDVNDPATLPLFGLNGIYTEGIIFVAGSVEYKSGGNGRDITILSPPSTESRYDHNTTALTENDLPIRPSANAAQDSVGLTDINVNGGVYVKGRILFSGSPKIFGAISAEHGFLGNGTPEIWYNYNLNVSDANDALCVFCCEIDVQPSSAALSVGDTRALTANGAAGAVQWESEDDRIATVSPGGVVTAVGAGTTRIKAVDQNNCPDWAVITVQPPCNGFAISPSSATVGFNGTQFFTASPVPAGSNIQWSSSDGSVASVAGAGGAATATGHLVVNATTVTINAHDTTGICPDDSAFLTVNPPACSLAVNPVTATARIGGAPVSLTAAGALGAVTWSASNTNAALLSTTGSPVAVRGDALGATVITATDNFFAAGTCTARSTVTVACGLTITGPAQVNEGQTIQLTANNARAPVTWTTSSAARATVTSPDNPTTVTGQNVNQNRSVTITATDANGCAAGVTITVINL